VMKVRVERAVTDDHVLPKRLATIERHHINESGNPENLRVIKLRMDAAYHWTLNGRTFVLDETAPDENLRLNTMQFIRLDNGHDEQMMHMRSYVAHRLPHAYPRIAAPGGEMGSRTRGEGTVRNPQRGIHRRRLKGYRAGAAGRESHAAQALR
jgi:hypothetical protein